jgi:hypothetical protein
MNTFNELFSTEDYWSLDENRPKYEIAFLISDQHLTPTGGIGQYAKAFYDMASFYRARVHFILDKTPSKEFYKIFDKAIFHYPDDPISYKLHSETYVHDDTLNMYKQANFHTAICKAKKYLGKKDFTIAWCNTNESILPAYTSGIGPVLIYTHLYRHIHKQANRGVFNDEFHHVVDTLSNLPNVYIGTQSEYNANLLRQYHKRVEVLPIPLPERSFLKEYDRSKTIGVLFVGRCEDGKRYKKFLEICSKAQVPVKILTSKKSAIKFKKYCIEYNLEHDIRHSLIGQEKLDFMLSSSILLNVSKHESYSMTTFECHGHMPVLTLNDQDWADAFDSRYVVKCPKKDVVDMVKSYHDMPYTKQIIDIKSWYENDSLYNLEKLDSIAYENFSDFLQSTT